LWHTPTVAAMAAAAATEAPAVPAADPAEDVDMGEEPVEKADGGEAKTEEDEMAELLKLPAAERVGMAASLKDVGNAALTAGQHDACLPHYNKGIKLLEGLLEIGPPEIEPEEQLQASTLYVSLNLNKAQAHLKLDDGVEAAKAASSVLRVDTKNVKAFYRRALASQKQGNLEEAKEDLTKLLEVDSQNKAARQELVQIREKIKAQKAAEKQRMANLFNGDSFYKAEHAKHEMDLEEWKREQEKRKADGEEEQIFEDWKKARDDKVKEEERKRKQEMEDAMKQRQKEQATERRSEVVKHDDLELDEEDKKILEEAKKKGYYHGRLHAVPSAAAPTPKALGEAESPRSIAAAPGKAVGSAWNANGTTYEERDCSDKVRDSLKAFLSSMSVGSAKDALKAEVTEVRSITGEGTRAVIRGSIRYGFELKVKLAFSVHVRPFGERDWKEYKGKVSFPELTDHTKPDDMRVETSWKNAPTGVDKESAAHGMQNLINHIIGELERFKAELVSSETAG